MREEKPKHHTPVESVGPMESGATSGGDDGDTEGNKNSWMLETLARAFGGYSQVPDHVVGMAIAGRINNGDLLGIDDAVPEFNRLVKQICERWADQNTDPKKVREDLLNGMKEEAKEWGQENRTWGVIHALESQVK